MTSVFFMGGTFDPVHRGHLAMAQQAYAAWRPDHLLFIPDGRNPLKKEQPAAGTEHRLEMLRTALQNTPFTIDEWELQRNSPSFTWHTVRHLRERFGTGVRLSMLIGEDLLAQLPQWYHWQDLEAELEFIILPRTNSDNVLQLPRNCHRLEAPLIEISSTQIRDTIATGSNVEDLLPPGVAAYIRKHELYSVVLSAKRKSSRT